MSLRATAHPTARTQRAGMEGRGEADSEAVQFMVGFAGTQGDGGGQRSLPPWLKSSGLS